MTKKADAYWPLILLLAIAKFVLPAFLQSSAYELHRDEYLYYEQGHHLALGFLENPPLISVMAGISSLFGGSEAMIKFWPCAVGAVTLFVSCLITAELGGKLFAQFITGLGIIGGSFLRTHFLFQPNMLDILSWTLAIYFIVRYTNDQKPWQIYASMFSLAFGFWGKYSVLFMAIALLASMVLTKQRKIYTQKHIYIAAIFSLIIIAPNIWWQYSHNWPLFHHMEELQETQLKYSDPKGFLINQLQMLSPAVLVWIAGLFFCFAKPNWRFIGLCWVFIIGLLLVGRGKAYYALGIYPALIAAGAAFWENFTEKRKWIRYMVVGFMLFFNWLLLPMLLPTKDPLALAQQYKHSKLAQGGFLKWEDQQQHPLTQDFADMLGWKELTAKAETFFNNLPPQSQDATVIYCDGYGQAGALTYYSKTKRFKEKITSANGSFLLWMPEPLVFENIIFVEEKHSDEKEALANAFKSHMMIGTISDTLSRQITNHIIWMEGASEPAKEMVNERFSKMKDQFRRKD